MPESEYGVIFEEFSERHYAKDFAKKYKGKAWSETRKMIQDVCERIGHIVGATDNCETICDSGDVLICKNNFAVMSTRMSPKSSGNRYILAIHQESCSVRVLLIYGKGHVTGGHETVWWKKKVSGEFPEYRDMLQ